MHFKNFLILKFMESICAFTIVHNYIEKLITTDIFILQILHTSLEEKMQRKNTYNFNV